MATHKLKTWPGYWYAVHEGYKNFEVRINDRDFKTGDTLILQEYNPDSNKYTGRELERTVAYTLSGVSGLGIESGYVVMGLHAPLS